MKKVARLLAVGGVSAMTALTLAAVPGTALANQDCSGYGTTSESAGPVTVAVQAGSGGSSLSQDSDVTAVGVCGYETLTPGFTGGTLEAGVGTLSDGVLYAGVPVVDTNPQPNGHTSCGWGLSDPQCAMTGVAVPGVYLVAQGQNGNTGQLQGYAGLSTLEQKNAKNDGGSTNSGGEIGLNGISVYNIPSPIVCGDTSGTDWNDTTRQGCEIP